MPDPLRLPPSYELLSDTQRRRAPVPGAASERGGHFAASRGAIGLEKQFGLSPRHLGFCWLKKKAVDTIA